MRYQQPTRAVNAVCATAGLPSPSWTDPISAGATPIRAVRILKLSSPTNS